MSNDGPESVGRRRFLTGALAAAAASALPGCGESNEERAVREHNELEAYQTYQDDINAIRVLALRFARRAAEACDAFYSEELKKSGKTLSEPEQERYERNKAKLLQDIIEVTGSAIGLTAFRLAGDNSINPNISKARLDLEFLWNQGIVIVGGDVKDNVIKDTQAIMYYDGEVAKKGLSVLFDKRNKPTEMRETIASVAKDLRNSNLAYNEITHYFLQLGEKRIEKEILPREFAGTFKTKSGTELSLNLPDCPCPEQPF